MAIFIKENKKDNYPFNKKYIILISILGILLIVIGCNMMNKEYNRSHTPIPTEIVIQKCNIAFNKTTIKYKTMDNKVGITELNYSKKYNPGEKITLKISPVDYEEEHYYFSNSLFIIGALILYIVMMTFI